MEQLIPKLMRIFGKQEPKVIIVGLDNAGKTTILYQFLMNEVVHMCPTIGSNVEEIVLQKTHFLIWDIGGQEALRSTWNTYYSNTEFIILVIDSTARDQLLTTQEELFKMLAHEDMEEAVTAVEISRFLTISAIKDHPWHIQRCCALTGEGLVAAPPGPTGPGPTQFGSQLLDQVKPLPTVEMLWAARWAPVDAVSGHCQLMSQLETNQKLWKFCLDYVGGKPK